MGQVCEPFLGMSWNQDCASCGIAMYVCHSAKRGSRLNVPYVQSLIFKARHPRTFFNQSNTVLTLA